MRLKLFFVVVFMMATLVASDCSAVIVRDVMVGTQVSTNGTALTIGQWNTAVGASLLADPTHDANNGLNGFDSNSMATTSYSGNWNFAYAPVMAPIDAASLSIGIYDHDSAAAGDQVASFTVDGVDLTAQLNTLINSSGGRVFPDIPFFTAEYNVYTVALPSTTFANLADGAAAISLQLQNGFAAGPLTTTNNNAAVDFSRLIISVPEPGTGTLFFLSAIAVTCVRRKRQR